MTVRQQQAMKIFMGGPYSVPGYKPIQGRYLLSVAAAIVGAITGESGVNLDSTVFRLHADHDSGGVAEWRLDRKTAMIAFQKAAGRAETDFEGQCWFLLYELENSPRFAALASTMRTPGDRSVTTLCWDFVKIYEDPNMAVAHMDDLRVPQAIKTYNTYKATSISTAAGGIAVGAGVGAVMTYNLDGPFIVVAVLVGLAVFHSWLNLTPPKLKDDTVPVTPPELSSVDRTPAALSTRDNYRAKKAALKTALTEFDAAQKEYKAELQSSSAELQDDPTISMVVDHALQTPAVLVPAI